MSDDPPDTGTPHQRRGEGAGGTPPRVGVVLEGRDGAGVIPPLAIPPPPPPLCWGMEVTRGSGDPVVWGTEVTVGLRETVV